MNENDDEKCAKKKENRIGMCVSIGHDFLFLDSPSVGCLVCLSLGETELRW